jgi:hypothetical protein
VPVCAAFVAMLLAAMIESMEMDVLRFYFHRLGRDDAAAIVSNDAIIDDEAMPSVKAVVHFCSPLLVQLGVLFGFGGYDNAMIGLFVATIGLLSCLEILEWLGSNGNHAVHRTDGATTLLLRGASVFVLLPACCYTSSPDYRVAAFFIVSIFLAIQELWNCGWELSAELRVEVPNTLRCLFLLFEAGASVAIVVVQAVLKTQPAFVLCAIGVHFFCHWGNAVCQMNVGLASRQKLLSVSSCICGVLIPACVVVDRFSDMSEHNTYTISMCAVALYSHFITSFPHWRKNSAAKHSK